MESTRPIRALARGLDALTVLNSRDGATVSEIAHDIKLPRTTVYRILETLSEAGFIFRDSTDDRYRLTARVRDLSEGFADEAWVTQMAKAHIDELCREVVWPVSIATVAGTAMVLRETTDHSTPLAVERYSAGFRAPLLATATGRVYLAFCPVTERDTLLDALARSNKEDDKPARAPRTELLRLLQDIRVQGYAATSRTRRLLEETSLAVPVMADDAPVAALTLRFLATNLPLPAALERFLPRLHQCAAKMGHHFSGQRAEAVEATASSTAG